MTTMSYILTAYAYLLVMWAVNHYRPFIREELKPKIKRLSKPIRPSKAKERCSQNTNRPVKKCA